MPDAMEPKAGLKSFRIPLELGFGVMLTVALLLPWGEHRVHILGALPYGLLLLCIVFHRLMHDGHNHGIEDGGI